MAAAEAEHTLQWVSLHEAAVRLAELSAADLKPLAAYAVEQQFRNGGYPYRYRDDGALHENDLSADFLREAVIDVAASTATQRERTERIPNPDLPLVRRDCTPQPQMDSPRSLSFFARSLYAPRLYRKDRPCQDSHGHRGLGSEAKRAASRRAGGAKSSPPGASQFGTIGSGRGKTAIARLR
jgi:hypothetical protein